MGAISRLSAKSFPSLHPGAPGRAGDLWEQTFGRVNQILTDKESSGYQSPRVRPQADMTIGTGRSLASFDAALSRLIQAMRSQAPGGWTDDRWEQSKQFVSIAYVAIHRKASMMSQAEFAVYEKDKNHVDGKRPIEDERHPAYQLVQLLEHPNPHYGFGGLLYRITQQRDLTGKALTWMIPNRLGVPMEMYSIPTAIAIPQPVINPDYPDGYYRLQPIYPYGPFSSYPTPNTSVGAPIPAQWMLEIKYPHPLIHYDGYSPLTGMSLELDELRQINRSRWYKMKRGSNPDVALDLSEMEGAGPLPESEIQRLVAQFENDVQGVENHGRLFVPPPGAKLDLLGTNPREMDYPQSWDQIVSFVLGGFGITKPAAGMVEDSSYATLFASLKQLHLITLNPDCQDIAQHFTRNLAKFFGKNLIVEIRLKRIDDHEQMMAKTKALLELKGLPEAVIRYAMRLLDLPTEPEVIQALAEIKVDRDKAVSTDLAEAKVEAELDGNATLNGEPKEPKPPGLEQEEQEMRGDTPGELGRGALGPRKSLSHNRIAARLFKAKHLTNGNGKHG